MIRSQVLGFKIRDADRADEAFLLQLDEGLPGLHVEVVCWNRPVDQVQVDVFELQPLEALP